MVEIRQRNICFQPFLDPASLAYTEGEDGPVLVGWEGKTPNLYHILYL